MPRHQQQSMIESDNKTQQQAWEFSNAPNIEATVARLWWWWAITTAVGRTNECTIGDTVGARHKISAVVVAHLALAGVTRFILTEGIARDDHKARVHHPRRPARQERTIFAPQE